LPAQDVESLRDLEESDAAFFALPLPDSDLRAFTVGLLGPDHYDASFRVSAPPGAAAQRPSPYAGGYFRVELTAPPDYPASPPAVRFVTSFMHPLVAQQQLCKEVVLEAWSDAWEPPAGAALEAAGAPVHPSPAAAGAPGGGRHLLTLLLFLRRLMVRPQEDFERGLGECRSLIAVRPDKSLDMDAFDAAVRAHVLKFAVSED
jgi:hypothetical protein